MRAPRHGSQHRAAAHVPSHEWTAGHTSTDTRRLWTRGAVRLQVPSLKHTWEAEGGQPAPYPFAVMNNFLK